MKITETKLKGVMLVEPNTLSDDHRGTETEIYNQEMFRQAGVDIDFVAEDISVSPKGILRGIHGDDKTWKLVSCLLGSYHLVVVNWEEGSPQKGQWESFTVSDQNRHQVLIPPNFGNGFVIMSENVVFHYRQSAYYNREGQFTLRWNDPALKIEWPVEPTIVSLRDEQADLITEPVSGGRAS